MRLHYSNKYLHNSNRPVRRWGYTGLFFKEIVKMGGFFKAQAIANFRYVPVGVL
jgi:hypothetical protein